MKDGRPFTFAGLWENWKDPESGEWLRTCTIITGEPNELVAQIHPRMQGTRQIHVILYASAQSPGALACFKVRIVSSPLVGVTQAAVLNPQRRQPSLMSTKIA